MTMADLRPQFCQRPWDIQNCMYSWLRRRFAAHREPSNYLCHLEWSSNSTNKKYKEDAKCPKLHAGVHAEGGIWSTLFGLLMWDALFAPVPDVFRTPFQTAPLDLSSPSFYPARTAVIKETLDRVRRGGAPAMIQLRWDQSYNTMCAGVNWQRNGERLSPG